MNNRKSGIAMDNFGPLSMHVCAVEFKEFLELLVDYVKSGTTFSRANHVNSVNCVNAPSGRLRFIINGIRLEVRAVR
jgi:hypothetical protein